MNQGKRGYEWSRSCSICLAFLVSFIPPAYAGEVSPWDIDRTQSTIDFQAKLWGGKIRGKFKRFEVEIRLDPERLPDSRIVAAIHAASIDTRNSERDAELRKDMWFDAGAFPTITYESTKINRTSDGYETVGSLTILGVRKDVRFPFTLSMSDLANGTRQAALDGATTIRRTDFNIGKGKWGKTSIVGDDVLLTVRIRASVPVK